MGLLKNMKKKEYIAPSCEVLVVETVSMIATSPNFDVENGPTTEESDPNDQGANRHRGEWGNLWN